MKKLFLVAVFIGIALISYSQQVSRINFDYIKEKTTDSSSVLFYPVLESRLLELDTTLGTDEYEFLYFGHVFSEKYNPYSTHDLKNVMRNEMSEGNYRSALESGWKIFTDNPVSIDINYQMMVCYHRLEVIDTARMFARNYYRFLNAIYESGDGKSVKTAYVVDCVNDEYHILSDMGLSLKQQSLVDGPCDKMEVNPEGKDTPDEFKKVKVVYFNVSKPFETLSRMFDE